MNSYVLREKTCLLITRFWVLIVALLPQFLKSQNSFQKEILTVSPQAMDIAENFKGDLYLTYDKAIGLDVKIVLVKLNRDGETIFERMYDHTPENDFYPHIIATEDAGCIIASESWSYATPDLLRTILIWKLNETGDIEWEKTIPTSGFDDIIMTSDSSYLLLGREYIDEFHTTLITARKMDKSGNVLWKTILGTTYDSSSIQNLATRPETIIEIDGYYYISGYSNNVSGESSAGNFYKLDSEGQLIWEQVLPVDGWEFYIIKGAFRIGNNQYFSALGEIYEFDTDFGNYQRIESNINLNFYQYQGEDFIMKCGNVFHMRRSNDSTFLREYINPNDYILEKFLPNIEGDIIDCIGAHDGGYFIVSEMDTSVLVTKTDCKGNYYWSGECNSKLKEEDELIIYPNPAVDEILIEVSFDIDKVSLYSLQGEIIDFDVNCFCQTHHLNISNLSSGVYHVIVSGEKRIAFGSFVKV